MDKRLFVGAPGMVVMEAIISSINENDNNNKTGGELVSMESRVGLEIIGVHKFSCV